MNVTLLAPAPDVIYSAVDGSPFKSDGFGYIREVPPWALGSLLAFGCTIVGTAPAPPPVVSESADRSGGFLVTAEVLSESPVAKAPTPRAVKKVAEG